MEGECSMLMGIAILVTHCTLYHCTTVVYLGGTVGSWETGGTLFKISRQLAFGYRDMFTGEQRHCRSPAAIKVTVPL